MHKDVSGGVFSTILNRSATIPESDANASIVLWKSWAWVHLEDGSAGIALQRLLSIPDGIPRDNIETSAASILRVRQYLSSKRDIFLSPAKAHHAVTYVECLALLEYLTGSSPTEPQSNAQGNITGAISVINSFSDSLISRSLSRSPSHELLLQSAARLLFNHCRIGPFRPALLREHLTAYLSHFPSNTIFLSIYTWNESRLRIDNRVRTLFLSSTLAPGNDTLTSRFFAIRYEIAHGTIHSARAAFEHAVSSPAAKSSPALWRFYIYYCFWTERFREKIAREVWQRAVRACPWAKQLYLIRFDEMSGMGSFGELRSLWRVMGEKELRVHVDLEDVFEEKEEVDREGRREIAN